VIVVLMDSYAGLFNNKEYWRRSVKKILYVMAFVVFSFVFVENSPAPPPPPTPAPVGGAIPSSVVIAAVAAYGVWRMRDK